jgi:16S rRNA (cytosine1402-N4)-methyltransferase
MEYRHIPVMLDDVMAHFNPQPGQYYIDCTMGGGGYTLALAEKVDPGKVLAIDADPMAVANARKKLNKNKNIIIAHDNFRNLSKIVEENSEGLAFASRPERHSAGAAHALSPAPQVGFAEFAGIILDLGLSSAQLEDRTRGFSFQLDDSPVEMGFGRCLEGGSGQTISTVDILDKYCQKELERIIRDYGEERFAGRIARVIVEARREGSINTVGRLVSIIRQAVPGVYARDRRIHFATRTFQALRIETNGELDSLRTALAQALDLLAPGGKLAVISYHSLEDRIVKDFFREHSRTCVCSPDKMICDCEHVPELKVLTKRVALPSPEEVSRNPRARSAKLRVAEKNC